MRHARVAAAGVLLLAFLRTPILPAQTAVAWLDHAERAYRDLEYDTVASLIRGGLARQTELQMAERARALTYLAASELFRGRRDSAIAVFRRLVLSHPRYRADYLIFPPVVTDLFQMVRLSTKAVVVRLEPDTAIRIGVDRFPIRLLVTSYHDVVAVVVRDDGEVVRSLYQGPVADSLDLYWNGRDAKGLTADGGPHTLRVTSLSAGGARVVRVVQVPLDIRVVRPDTVPELPPLPDSLLLPVRVSGRNGFASLGAGLLSAGAVIALPRILAGTGDASPARYAVAGAAGALGIVGFVIQFPGRALHPNVRANAARRDEWNARAAAIRAENAERQRNPVLRIQAGTAMTLDPETP